MGRIFEKRKHTMFARFDRMAKQFTRIGKEIAIAVKQSGPNPENNPKLRTVMQNAKAVNMPKDRVDAAIKRASSKGDSENYEEVRFEGYAPHGVGVLVETATDNNTRTVANVRMHFNKGGGAMGKTGSLDFIFTRKGVFKIEKSKLGGRDLDDFEFELIDFGLETNFPTLDKKTLAPGESMPIRVFFDTVLKKGNANYNIWVVCNDPVSPERNIPIKAVFDAKVIECQTCPK
ncbi:MAG: YebC/PmpR family DNA-binding transcriptional regulator [Chitinophagia bacterium]|nr:YebC/PmpR family DNA-binding transcriptional regulator [Chitinophagia bacterium]